MRKLYHSLLVLIICALWFTSTQAQRKLERVHPASAKPTISAGTASQLGTTADCDSVNLATALANWSSTTYVFSGDSGFLNGTNYGLDKQKANYIDLSSTAYTYLTEVLVAFGAANSSVAAN